jgi:hypothetical protein
MDVIDKLIGIHGSYFHNNFLIHRKEDAKKGLIDSSSCDDVICRLNGYAIIPIEEYCKLRGEDVPDGTEEKINDMNRKIHKLRKQQDN